ncbi:MAG: undecaprenyldiphospho-muramoylpentapeptide beta-N-acetylglucosaminyltransferase [Pseudomonadales bacterium]
MASRQGKQSIVIMAGGTGGHVFPGLAVAHELSQAGVEIHWLGTQRGIESRLVPAAGYALHFLSVEGVRGRGLLSWLKAPFLLLMALQQALRVLSKTRPGCVLGMGGFAAGPGAVAAKLLGLPLVLHEQNAVIGTTNKLLAPVANRRLQGFPGTFKQQRDTYYVGNPLRHELLEELDEANTAQRTNGAIRIFVLGGSRGAAALNTTLPTLLATLRERYELQFEVQHQTGEVQRDDVEASYKALKIDAQVSSFIDKMAAVYRWADVVICRAGAMTVAELAAAGKASVLVPYPYAIDDHQTMNANWLVKKQAGFLVQQDDLLQESTLEKLGELLVSRNSLQAMGRNAAGLAQREATERVAAHCLELANG